MKTTFMTTPEELEECTHGLNIGSPDAARVHDNKFDPLSMSAVWPGTSAPASSTEPLEEATTMPAEDQAAILLKVAEVSA